ncbi:ATP-binding cassette domain-containing protein, partial [Bradyrhizobium sp. WSM1743]|uniref:ATP-binding cassette domain-containing protein n=1 Tax=Bradyrhizobium sp. WSM1743 TaxID=318996 RepID=UPI001FDA2AEF
MRRLISRSRLMTARGFDRALNNMQSVKIQHRGLAVVGGASMQQAPGPGRGTMPDADNAFVKFSDIQKSYDGEALVVKNLNLDIARGEFLTMLGPSGSGKTTTLMMLAGF